MYCKSNVLFTPCKENACFIIELGSRWHLRRPTKLLHLFFDHSLFVVNVMYNGNFPQNSWLKVRVQMNSTDIAL